MPDTGKRNARISWWIPRMIAIALLAIHNMSFNINFMFRATALASGKFWSKAAGHRCRDNRRPDRLRAAITKG
jgi:hypothetical protein